MTEKMDPQHLLRCMPGYRYIAADEPGRNHAADIWAYTHEPKMDDDGRYQGGTGATHLLRGILIDIEPGQCIKQEPREVLFCSLEIGDTFAYGPNRYTYRKLDGDERCNAFCVEDWETAHFNDHEKVIIVEEDDND